RARTPSVPNIPAMSIALYQVIIHWQTATRARQVYKYGRRQIGTSGETGLSRILILQTSMRRVIPALGDG
ncbi:MAG TPA: hypothetical protein DD665_01400, partial [Alphaproteobacteria bacterium]|nr:hypothetical protein [Alphaproteobacteria bacterium]